VLSEEIYGSDARTIRRNLIGPRVLDTDDFRTNQFGHPYQGSMYLGFARSAGLSYWQSLFYTAGGSILWEIAGETDPPSVNDHIATAIGGSFFGEALFRMASLVLETGDVFWRELLASVISPPTGFNRLAFGERFDPVFQSRDPARFAQLRLGARTTVYPDGPGVHDAFGPGGVTGNFSLAYGLPGKPGYHHTRPFDYFNFEAGGVGGRHFYGNVMARGLLLGADYGVGESYRGIWGLYGIYNFLSPEMFRVSTTALMFGTTGQAWLSQDVAVQGTALGGVGYGAAGERPPTGERDYHFGVTPHGVLALRVIFGEAAMLDGAARDYYVSRLAETKPNGSEHVAHLNAAIVVRVSGRHAVGLQYEWAHRNGSYEDIATQDQILGTVGLFYSFLSDTRFGAVEWRGVSGH
jgi:hypothetical protein